MPRAEQAAAHESLAVPALHVGPGAWAPPRGAAAAIGLLVVTGVLVCVGPVCGYPDAQLFGPGDFFDARLLAEPSGEWRVLVAAELAIVDARLVVAARRWPQLVRGITSQLFDGRRREHLLAVIRGLPHVEERLLALMAELGARWGRVTPEGLVVVLPASHELLGRLVAARRPTVSQAVAALREEGVLIHASGGRWLLPLEAAEWPATGVPGQTTQARARRVRRREQARRAGADRGEAGTAA